MNAASVRDVLRRNLETIEGRMRAACQRAGRPRGDVTLIAVTKTVSADVAAMWPELGVADLGESRPQELWHKATVVPAGIRWHMIGHLQRNKVERTLPLVAMVHSVDSLRLLQAIDQVAEKQGCLAEVLLEVNASGEASKHGFAPDELLGLTSQIQACKNVHKIGLMTMAAPTDDPEDARSTFLALRELRDKLGIGFGSWLPHLSMGMSDDFEVAVEEGATLVRIGTALYEGIDA